MSGPRTEKVDPLIVLLDGQSGESGFFENIGGYLQEGARIDRLAVQSHLEMQMRPGRAAGAADDPDQLAGRDRLPGMGAEAGHVGVARQQAVAMVDLDAIAVAGALADEGDRAPR